MACPSDWESKFVDCSIEVAYVVASALAMLGRARKDAAESVFWRSCRLLLVACRAVLGEVGGWMGEGAKADADAIVIARSNGLIISVY